MEYPKRTLYGGRSTPYKNVRFGYSIYFIMKQLKSTFNSYSLFLDVILLQNMVNVLLIARILRCIYQDKFFQDHYSQSLFFCPMFSILQ